MRVIKLFCVGLLVSHIGWAQTESEKTDWEIMCEENGGTPIKNNDKTATFCRSNKVLSWYASHAWCHKIGGRLATLQKLCGTSKCSGNCTQMAGTGDATYKWGFVNFRSGDNCCRINLMDKNKPVIGTTKPLNRPVKDALTDESVAQSSQFGKITDMYALCEEMPQE